MFNPANLANEVFGILRSFDYVVNIFDFDGNRVYEPSEARRFFASPKNITVSIHEDGENSSIKMFLSKSIDVSEISGLISTMRATASKFGVLFNVRKYERELKPKDLAPNGASDFDAGVSLSSAESPSDQQQDGGDPSDAKTPELSFKDKDDTSHEGDTLDRITGEVTNLTKNFKKIMGLLHDKKVKESMTNTTTPLNEAEGQTVHLGILGVDVEADAWNEFKQGKLPLASKPNLNVDDTEVENYTTAYVAKHDGSSFDHTTAIKSLQLLRIIKAVEPSAPLLATAFGAALQMFQTGAAPKVIDAVVNKAISAAAYSDDEGVPDHDGKTPTKNDFVTIKEFTGKVERQAWQDFVNDHIDLSGSIDFNAVKLGPSANKLAAYLGLISDKTTQPGLANLFAQFANDMNDGRSTPFKQKVALHAIEIAKHGKVDVGESIIMSESIREFANWFDSLSGNAIFEGGFYRDDFPFDDRDDRAYDLAYKTVKENFHPDAFLDTVGKSDFGYGDDTMSDDEKTVGFDELKSSLAHYLKGELDGALEDEYPNDKDADGLADDLIESVIDAMGQTGWTVTVADHSSDQPVEEDAPVKTCDCMTECDCDKGDASTELSTEDVVLPSRPDDDLSNEVTAHHDGDDMDRIIALARGAQATQSPRTPQP